MIELKPPQFPSKAIYGIGYEPIKSGIRGNVHVQFHDGNGNLTSRGMFKNVQRVIFNGLDASPNPGRFLNQNLTGDFDWVRTDGGETDYSEEEIDRTLPNVIVIGVDVPNTIEAITACIDAQRIKPEGVLFT